jgi:hypothetical protein
VNVWLLHTDIPVECFLAQTEISGHLQLNHHKVSLADNESWYLNWAKSEIVIIHKYNRKRHSIINYKYFLQCNKSHYIPESSILSYDRASHSCRQAICVVTQQCLVIPLISLIHCMLPA